MYQDLGWWHSESERGQRLAEVSSLARAAASTPRAWSLFSCRGTEAMAVLYVDGLDAGVFCCDAAVPDVDAAVKQPQTRNAGSAPTFWATTRTTTETTSGSSVRRSETVFPLCFIPQVQSAGVGKDILSLSPMWRKLGVVLSCGSVWPLCVRKALTMMTRSLVGANGPRLIRTDVGGACFFSISSLSKRESQTKRPVCQELSDDPEPEPEPSVGP